MTFDTVLFDLDGTLLDTAPDMIATINRMRQQREQQAIEAAELRPFVSHGSIALLREGLGIHSDAPEYEDMRQRFLDDYHDNICIETALFDGMDDILNHLESTGTPWGVVTNKPGWLTHKLMSALALDQRAACIVSGDTVEHSKPHPLPMQYACEVIGVPPSKVLYIGDAERDIIAGKAAGMATLVAGFGYLGSHDTPESWGADAIIDHPSEILNWL